MLSFRQEYFTAFRLEYSTAFRLEYSTAFRLEYCPVFLHQATLICIPAFRLAQYSSAFRLAEYPSAFRLEYIMHSGKSNFCFPAFKQEMSSACLNSGKNNLLHAAFRKVHAFIKVRLLSCKTAFK
jgi:hypothetical protein